MTNVNFPCIDSNSNGNLSVWASEVQSGPNVGLGAVYAKIGGVTHVLRGSLQVMVDAKQLAWDIYYRSNGRVNMLRWTPTAAPVTKPLVQELEEAQRVPTSSETVVAVDLMEGGKVNSHALKGEVFTGVLKITPRAFAAKVRKRGKINLEHWAAQ